MALRGWEWAEHLGDKKPIGLMLSFLSVFAFTAWGYFGEQTNLFADWWQEDRDREWMVVAIENVSINKHADFEVVQVVCERDPNCLPPYDDQTALDQIGDFVERFNSASTDRRVCAAPGGMFRFTFSLQPGESVMVRVKARAAEVSVQHLGRTPTPCAMARVDRIALFLTRTSMVHTAKAGMLRYSRELAIALAALVALALIWLVVVPLQQRRRHAPVRKRKR